MWRVCLHGTSLLESQGGYGERPIKDRKPWSVPGFRPRFPRTCYLDVAKCDIKCSAPRPWRATQTASGIYGARRSHGRLRVVRAFVKLRELAMAHKEIRQKLGELERKVVGHDKAIAGLINAIRELMIPPEPKKKRPIGFAPWEDK